MASWGGAAAAQIKCLDAGAATGWVYRAAGSARLKNGVVAGAAVRFRREDVPTAALKIDGSSGPLEMPLAAKNTAPFLVRWTASVVGDGACWS